MIDRNTIVYFDSFGIEYIPQEVLEHKKIEKMLLGRTLSDYTNLFYLDDYKTNEKVSINTSTLEFRLKKRDETKKIIF